MVDFVADFSHFAGISDNTGPLGAFNNVATGGNRTSWTCSGDSFSFVCCSPGFVESAHLPLQVLFLQFSLRSGQSWAPPSQVPSPSPLLNMDEEETSGDVGSAPHDESKFEFEQSAFVAHLAACNFRSRQVDSQPWQKRLKMPDLFSELPSVPFRPTKDDWGAFKMDSTAMSVLPLAMSSALPKNFVVKKKDNTPWHVKLSQHRAAAIAKWLAVVGRSLQSFKCGRQHSADPGSDLGNIVRDVVASKEASTLHARVGPLLRYCNWCKANGLVDIPFSESSVYKFVADEGAKAAPTFAKSFCTSLAFCGHVLECDSALECISSGRVTGAASGFYKTKRKLVQRPPLSVCHLRLLEQMVLGTVDRKLVDRIAAGFCCWMVYARCRHSDAQASGSLFLDVQHFRGGPRGYLEARVCRTKSSMNLERKTRYLSVVAPIYGLEPQPWACKWMELLDEAKVPRGPGKPLMPSPAEGGGWSSTPISAEASSAWLRSLLVTAGQPAEVVLKYGSHSCKSTVLSWLAKHGTEPHVRAILGYHVSKAGGTELVYGRDNLSAPLRIMEDVVSQVAQSTFDPDATRSGMFAKGSGAAAGDDPVESESSSSEDSADEEDPQHILAERAADNIVGEWNGHVQEDEVRGASLFRHVMSRVIHIIADEAGSYFRCGRGVTKGYSLCSRPMIMNPLCKQCFGKKSLGSRV